MLCIACGRCAGSLHELHVLTYGMSFALRMQFGFATAAVGFAVQYPVPAGPQPGMRPAYYQPPQQYVRPGQAPYAAATGPTYQTICS